MPLEHARFADDSTVSPLSAAHYSDAAVIVFKHALKIWAREQGVAERDLNGLTEVVAEYADAVIRDYLR